MLTHQCDEHHDDMYNVGGFTDGDRAACHSVLGRSQRAYPIHGLHHRPCGFKGTTNPERKLAKLGWMKRVLDLLDPEWPTSSTVRSTDC